MKSSFVVYTDYLELTKALSNDQMGVLFRNILKYVADDETEEMDALTQMAFDFIKLKTDRDIEKYEEVCEKRRQAGRKGGQAKQMLANASKCKQVQDDNENDNDNDNENDNENDNDKSSSNNKGLSNNKSSNNNKRFIPPTVNEVREYCIDKSYNIDPDAFVDFYSSKGWMVGKNKMKDWKAAVRNWARTDNQYRKKNIADEWRNA